MEIYRVRKGLFGTSVLQCLAVFPEGLPGAPDNQWVDVKYRHAPTPLVNRYEHMKKVHELEEELAGK